MNHLIIAMLNIHRKANLFILGIALIRGATVLSSAAAERVVVPPPNTTAGIQWDAAEPKPDDRRLGKLRTTDDSTFPMRPVTRAEAWPARRDDIRTRVLVAAGLHPLPKRSPLNAIVYGQVERDDYTVERVIFESFPGHFVTGSLYRPKSPATSRRPAVLNPYGHWKGGRFHDRGAEGVRQEIAAGAERFESGGRHLIQARCVQLARMGCVALVYDMEGFADSVQLEHAAGPRRDDAGKPGYLLFSPQAELHGQTMFGLQTWNSIRALDFLGTLNDVDPRRIGVTGASGGGTQAMILGAVDDRIAAAFPAVMVSAAAQGGCTCENAPYLRINQGNIDIAAALAPRPLGLICANDWTKALESKGHPDLKALYTLLQHPGDYEAHFHLQFPHNYNAVNRQHMYSFMNRHLKLGLPEPIVERDYVPLDVATEASVWTEKHPKPEGEGRGEPHERKLTADWTRATEAALQAMSAEARHGVIVEGVTTMVGRLPAEVGPVKWSPLRASDGGNYRVTAGMLNVAHHGEQPPALFIYPKQKWNRQLVIWLADAGQAGLFGGDGKPIPAVAALVNRGYGVASVDMFGQGALAGGGGKAVRLVTRGKGNEPYQQAACYTFGYNPPLAAQRVHDVMSLVEYLRRSEGDRPAERIHLVAIGKEAGPVGLIARIVLGDLIDQAAIDAQGFRFDAVDRFDHPMFLPGILRYGGMDALWALNRKRGAANIDGANAALGALGN
ncbi:MAG: acetylxylan esterase [Kiritimatiellaeota bacterium]|nr:acetylxylan esterase [Kiritimatiellota bacterium]